MRLHGRFGDYEYDDKSEPFGSGGESDLFACSQDGLLYKRYKIARSDASVVAQLHRVRDIGRQVIVTENQNLGSTPEASINWPIDTVEDGSNGAVLGVIIPEIPTRFYLSPGKRRTLDFLLLARADPPDASARLAVLIRLAEIFAFLDRSDLFHGDLSVGNVVWCIRPEAGAYLIDCDGLQSKSTPHSHGVQTPDWIDPRLVDGLISLHDHYSDRYALALAMYRGLLLNKGNLGKVSGSKSWPKPTALPRDLPTQLRTLFNRSLGRPLDADSRPSPEEWVSTLMGTFVKNGAYDAKRLATLERHAQQYRDEHQRLSGGFGISQTRKLVQLPPVKQQTVQLQPPRRRSNNRKPPIAILGILILVGAIVAYFSVVKSRGGPAARQAQAIDSIFQQERPRGLNSALEQVRTCSNLKSAVKTIRNVTESRRNRFHQVRRLEVDHLAHGAVIKKHFVAAMSASLKADKHFLVWAKRDVANGCSGDWAEDRDYRRALKFSKTATTAKKKFIKVWNPTARNYGFPERSKDDV